MKKLGLFLCSSVLFFSCAEDPKEEPQFNFDEKKLMDKIWQLEGEDKADGFRLTKDYKYEDVKNIGTAEEKFEESGTWAITEGRLSVKNDILGDLWANHINVTELTDTILKFDIKETLKYTYKMVEPSKAPLLVGKKWKFTKVTEDGVEQDLSMAAGQTFEFKTNGDYMVNFPDPTTKKIKTTKIGTWELSKDGTKFTIISVREGSEPIVYTVTELTATTFTIELTSDGTKIVRTHGLAK